MKKKFVFLWLIFFLTLFFDGSFCFAQEFKGYDFEIILDASSNMNETIDGKSKMEIAKNAIKEVVGELPEGFYIGLRTFGFQFSPNDDLCDDTELIYPVSQINKDIFISKLEMIYAGTSSPIAFSVISSANDFSDKKEYKKVAILLSAGGDSCQQDICSSALLSENERKITFDVIGFGVDEQAKNNLQCIANSSGGKYYDASQANLAEILKNLLQRDLLENNEDEVYFSEENEEDFYSLNENDQDSETNSIESASFITVGSYGGDVSEKMPKFFKVFSQENKKIAASISTRRGLSTDPIEACSCAKPEIAILDENGQVLSSKTADGCDDGSQIMGIAPSASSFFEYRTDFIVEETSHYYLRIKNSWEKTCGDMDERVWQKEIEAVDPKVFYLLELEMDDYSQNEFDENSELVGDLEKNNPTEGKNNSEGGGKVKLFVAIFLGLVGVMLIFFVARFFLKRRELGQLEDLLGDKDVLNKKPMDNLGNNLGVDQGNNLEKKIEKNFSGNGNVFSEKKEDFLNKKEFGRNARPDFFSGKDNE